MPVVSDSNILSSLAAADALDLLAYLFRGDKIFIPQAVEQELQVGLTHGAFHLQHIFQAIHNGEIQILRLTEFEQTLTTALPHKLHAGEKEGIVLCQLHNYLFLSNDRRAVQYCQATGIKTINLEAFLRALWVQRLQSQQDVKALIQTIQSVEKLVITQEQLTKIFAPYHRKR
jgi:predicted nucleic acid-binding protein